MSNIRDILPAAFLEAEPSVILENVRGIIDGYTLQDGKSSTPRPAKSLTEFYALVKEVIDYHELHTGVIDSNQVLFTEEDPDASLHTETISVSLAKRIPGQFGEGAPMQGKVRNRKPIVREITKDLENPGYQIFVLGYYYDNLVQFTPWARTNKAANNRALWFEKLMLQYDWFFRVSGVNRVMFQERDSDITRVKDGQTLHGRPMTYFVRTEDVTVMKEVTINQLVLKYSAAAI